MDNVILIRHGQSCWNLENRFTGWVDVDLSENGVKEAKEAASILKENNIEIDHVFTSVLKRSIQTAELILNILEKENLLLSKAGNSTKDITARYKVKIKKRLRKFTEKTK